MLDFKGFQLSFSLTWLWPLAQRQKVCVHLYVLFRNHEPEFEFQLYLLQIL